MSNTSNAIPEVDTIGKGTSKIKSTLNRGVNFVKTHKKATIAVTVLTGLVVANAIVEKKAIVTLTPIKVEITDGPDIEVTDTSSN